MSNILIVDDSSTARRFIAGCVATIPGVDAVAVEDATIGLSLLADTSFDMVITDLVMEGMNGLEFVAALQTQHPTLPVVLTTAQGSENLATLALRAGAVGYVAKRDVESELVPICEQVLKLRADTNRKVAVLGCCRSGQLSFELPSDPSMATGLAKHLQEIASSVVVTEKTESTRLGVAYTEALLNAVIHGNLGISSELKERGPGVFENAVEKRRHEAPYRDRVVQTTFYWNQSIVSCVIRDEGNGFDQEMLPDPADPENLLKPHGRGVVLMKSFMDFVGYNKKGNEVTLTKHFVARPAFEPAVDEMTVGA